MKKILIYSVLCLIAALPVSAQKFYKDAINITNASLWQQGESLYINMQMESGWGSEVFPAPPSSLSPS